jgi:hypothetical protein
MRESGRWEREEVGQPDGQGCCFGFYCKCDRKPLTVKVRNGLF